MIDLFDLPYIVSGAAVGLLVGATGVGGGSLMTPLLVMLFGVHPATAVGTDLLFATTTKCVGTAVHGIRSTVDWRVVRRLATGSIPAALMTLFFISTLDKQADSGAHFITSLLAPVLILTGIAMLYRDRIAEWTHGHMPPPEDRIQGILTVTLGFVIGVLVTLTSVGAGAIGVVVLLLIYRDFPLARIVGTDIAHAVPLALVAGVGHLMVGSVNLVLLGSLLIGSIPGVIAGSILASRLGENRLRYVMAFALVAVGAKLILK